MTKPTIAVIIGSIREGRKGEKVAAWFMDAAKDIESANLVLIDLKDHSLPLFADAVSPSVREGKHSNPDVQAWLDSIEQADGYIFITPEYNHSIPGPLKNAVDYGFKEWNNKPIGFIGYGGVAGGSRSVEHWRQIAAELQMYDIREQVLIPIVWQAFDEQGNLKNADMHVKTANLIVEKLAKLAVQLKA